VATTTAVGATVGAAAAWAREPPLAPEPELRLESSASADAQPPTVVYPETALTFRIETPVTISTTRAPQAFRYVDPNEYDRPPRHARYPCAAESLLWPSYYPYTLIPTGVRIWLRLRLRLRPRHGIGFGRGWGRRW